MRILPNHFECKPTIFIKDRIINGCQDFTIDRVHYVCAEHGVPESTKQEVLDNYTGVSTDEEITAVLEKYLNSTELYARDRVLMAIARHGSDAHRTMILECCPTSESIVGIFIAHYGNDEHREILSKSHFAVVRRAVAKFSNEQQCRRLLDDPHPLVKEAAEERLHNLLVQ